MRNHLQQQIFNLIEGFVADHNGFQGTIIARQERRRLFYQKFHIIGKKSVDNEDNNLLGSLVILNTHEEKGFIFNLSLNWLSSWVLK